MKTKMKEEYGSVTVEATISLSAFMFAIVTLLTIVNVCLVQAKMSIAINDVAKELSQYSYLYSLTGINGSQSKLAEAAKENENGIDGVISDVGTVFTEIQNLGKDKGERAVTDLSGTLSSLENIKTSGESLKGSLEKLADDPKSVAIGLLKIVGNDGMDLVKSRLIAAPLAKGLCKKNLKSSRDGNVEDFLKGLGVVPAANGSYLDGLDFSKSTLFPDGSNEIRITVSYDVKVIPLLPLDFSFHFCQSAVTHGWMCGEESYRTMQQALSTEDNNTIWTKGTIAERTELIRNQGIKSLLDDGGVQVCGDSYQYVQGYNPSANEFTGIYTMNPLYSAAGEDTLTLDDISEQAIRESVEYMCAGVNTQVDKLSTVNGKKPDGNGSSKTESYDCKNAKKKIILVVPQDEGLQDKIQSIVDSAKTNGVTVEIQAFYGNGARTSVSTDTEGSQTK